MTMTMTKTMTTSTTTTTNTTASTGGRKSTTIKSSGNFLFVVRCLLWLVGSMLHLGLLGCLIAVVCCLLFGFLASKNSGQIYACSHVIVGEAFQPMSVNTRTTTNDNDNNQQPLTTMTIINNQNNNNN